MCEGCGSLYERTDFFKTFCIHPRRSRQISIPYTKQLNFGELHCPVLRNCSLHCATHLSLTPSSSFTIPVKKNKKTGSKGSRKPSGSSTAITQSSTTTTAPHGFGEWDPRLTNCSHYAQFHRDAARTGQYCTDPQYDPNDPEDTLHTAHMLAFHTDAMHPGFCTFGGYEDYLNDELDLENSDIESHQQPHIHHDHHHNHEHEEGEEIFSMDLPTIPFISHTEKRHKVLCKLLKLNDDPELSKVFTTLATITDPMTQPMESDTYTISLDLLSKLTIAFCYDKSSIIADFTLAKQLFIIIENSLKLFNCDDDVKLRSLNNSDLKVDWKPRVRDWTPHGIKDQELRLLYMINCVCIYTIYKIYSFSEPDLCLNPFLGFFIKLWKVFTNVVLLGLEVDRRVEQVGKEDTPNIIKQVIRGSSAIRYVLASILNDDMNNRYHDFNHLNILHFLSPYGRRNGSGALYADVRWYVGAMLALGSELNEVVETLVDLEPNDRYDEDVKYMFAHEYEDFHHEALFPEDYVDGEPLEDPIIYEDEDGILHRVVHQRCTCQFFDDDDDAFADGEEIEEGAQEDEANFSAIPTAVRSEQDIEFDEFGRDWRDVPREGNIFFNPNFVIDESQCFKWPELAKVFDDMTQAPVSEKISRRVVMTIARAVKFEFEQEINKTVSQSKTESIPEDLVTPDKVYQRWSHEWTFEAMLALNPVASYAMLDEMFMAHGYRRVLIWFITHMALSFTLMNYVFELVNGLRGEARISKTYGFSRQGPLVISEVEKSMLLHEFLNNCLIFLSKTYDNYKSKPSAEAQNVTEFQKCVKIVKLICLMVEKLLERDAIDMEEYKVELTSLLINWIGFIPEAKALFFKINSNEDPKTLDELEMESRNASAPSSKPVESSPTTMSTSPPSTLPMRHKKFNNELKVALGNVIKKLDNGSLLFRPFFELINYDNGKSGDELSTPVKDDDTGVGTMRYIPGEMKPLKKHGFLEHEQVDMALGE